MNYRLLYVHWHLKFVAAKCNLNLAFVQFFIGSDTLENKVFIVFILSENTKVTQHLKQTHGYVHTKMQQGCDKTELTVENKIRSKHTLQVDNYVFCFFFLLKLQRTFGHLVLNTVR